MAIKYGYVNARPADLRRRPPPPPLSAADEWSGQAGRSAREALRPRARRMTSAAYGLMAVPSGFDLDERAAARQPVDDVAEERRGAEYPPRSCRSFTFWVTRRKSRAMPASAAIARCAGLGWAARIRSRRSSYHAHTSAGSFENASGVASRCGSMLRQ
jgi:hypothetical protein